MIVATCHCGAVRVEVERAPAEVTDCTCSICRRYGVLWAYYRVTEVRITGVTATYGWGRRSLLFHRCVACGCVLHWAAVDPARDRVGVNARLMTPEVVGAARVRHLDGAVTEMYLD